MTVGMDTLILFAVIAAIVALAFVVPSFAPYRRNRKVTVFGSARTGEGHPAYQQALAFGRAMAEHDWWVVTGAASGIMEAGHRGAGREKSMGLNILLPFEQEANPVIVGDHKLVHMKYFFTRKLMFVKECNAVVCLPGGFGTLDEALEVLTLLQTGKRDLVPLVLLDYPGGTYWQAFVDFVREHLLAEQMISPTDFSLFKRTDSCVEAVEELLTFYRVFHSMRYVKQRLVLRLQRTISATTLDRLNRDYRNILARGEFQLRSALSEERDEPDLADLPRLALEFNRRDLGRLREVIDIVNRDGQDA